MTAEAKRNPAEELGLVNLTHGELAIVEALSDAYPRRLYIHDLVASVYSHDPNGGPHHAEDVLRTQISRLRKRLPPHGWTIPQNSRGAGNRGFYRLAPITEQERAAA